MKFRLIEDVEKVEYDSDGNPITRDQSEFFKDSKVRDSHGRLLVCYHGAKVGGFTKFNPKSGSQFGNYKFGNHDVNFFTTDEGAALTYTDIGVKEADNLYAVYLNITNPYIVINSQVSDMVPNSWANIKDPNIRKKQIEAFERFWKKWKFFDDDSPEMIEELNDDLKLFNCGIKQVGKYYDIIRLPENKKYGNEESIVWDYTIEELFDSSMYEEMKEAIIGEDEDDYVLTTNDIVRYVLDMNRHGSNYDGIVVPDIIDVGPLGSMFAVPANTIITLDSPNQIKSITNKTPTNSDNINEGSYGVEIGYEKPTIRGEKALREFVCDLLHLYCNHYLSADEFMIHHRNGNHQQQSVDNILLLPKYDSKTTNRNYNSTIHNEIKNHELNLDKNDPKYNLMLIYMDAIDVLKSIKSGKIVNVNGEDIYPNLMKRGE